MVDSLISYDEENGEMAVFLVNRSESDEVLKLDLRAFSAGKLIESKVLYSDDLKLNNASDHNAVKPSVSDNVCVQDKEVSISLKPFSFQMVRLGVK